MGCNYRKPEHHNEDPAWSKQNKTKTKTNKLKLGRGSAPIERANSSCPIEWWARTPWRSWCGTCWSRCRRHTSRAAPAGRQSCLSWGCYSHWKKEEDPSWQVPQGRRLRGSGRCPGPGPAHLLTLAARSSWSPRVAVGATWKVTVKVIWGGGRNGRRSPRRGAAWGPGRRCGQKQGRPGRPHGRWSGWCDSGCFGSPGSQRGRCHRSDAGSATAGGSGAARMNQGRWELVSAPTKLYIEVTATCNLP